MRAFKKALFRDKAVSEVFGTILLLVITVTLFSVVYVSVFSTEVTPAAPSVNIVGTIKNNDLILAHLGGEQLNLDTMIILYPKNGISDGVEVGEVLTDKYKSNDYWDIGEDLTYILDDLENFSRFDELSICIVDRLSNTVIMSGTLREERYTDIKVYFNVDDLSLKPKIGDVIEVNVIAENLGQSYTDEVSIEVKIPDGLVFIEYSGNGTYDEITGIWQVGYIEPETNATLTLKLLVKPTKPVFTQLAFILDGSEAITPTQWNMIKTGISNAILDGYIPHEGYVQLTIVQYGLGTAEYEEPFARTEISPTVITAENYNDIASVISLMNQIEGNSRPMAHGFVKTTDLLFDSTGTSDILNYRQVINLVAGANPNLAYPQLSTSKLVYNQLNAWSSAIKERDKMIQRLGMTPAQDEIDVEAIMGDADDLDLEKLSEIAYPYPISLYSSVQDPQDKGWVKEVYTSSHFNSAIQSLFDIVFDSRTITAKLLSTKYPDTNSSNDFATVTILAEGS